MGHIRYTAFAALVLVAALGLPTTAAAKEEGDLLVRLRGVAIAPAEDGTTDLIGGSIDIDNAYVPELDFSYFITNNIAVELILATARLDVTVENSTLGDVSLGDTWIIPPVLAAQYHFWSQERFSPYVGAGVAYHIFFGDSGGNAVVNNVEYEDGFGWALQAGFDYSIAENWSLNVDVKKVFFETDVTVTSTAGRINAKDVDIDHWIFGIGVGYRF